jgi:hypothetical protein
MNNEKEYYFFTTSKDYAHRNGQKILIVQEFHTKYDDVAMYDVLFEDGHRVSIWEYEIVASNAIGEVMNAVI